MASTLENLWTLPGPLQGLEIGTRELVTLLSLTATAMIIPVVKYSMRAAPAVQKIDVGLLEMVGAKAPKKRRRQKKKSKKASSQGGSTSVESVLEDEADLEFLIESQEMATQKDNNTKAVTGPYIEEVSLHPPKAQFEAGLNDSRLQTDLDEGFQLVTRRRKPKQNRDSVAANPADAQTNRKSPGKVQRSVPTIVPVTPKVQRASHKAASGGKE